MPVLHKNADNGKFFVRTVFGCQHVTLQMKHCCHEKLLRQGFRNKDAISWEKLRSALCHPEELYTRAGGSAPDHPEPLFTWAELETNNRELIRSLVQAEIKIALLDREIAEERQKVGVLEAHCHQWSDAYSAIESDLTKARDQTSSASVALQKATLHRNIAFALCAGALLVFLSLLVWSLIQG